MWLKNSSGNEDPILTMSWIVVIFILFKFLLSGVSITFHGSPISFGNIDSGMVASLLTPTLGAYVTHRFGELKYGLGVDDAAQGEKK